MVVKLAAVKLLGIVVKLLLIVRLVVKIPALAHWSLPPGYRRNAAPGADLRPVGTAGRAGRALQKIKDLLDGFPFS